MTIYLVLGLIVIVVLLFNMSSRKKTNILESLSSDNPEERQQARYWLDRHEFDSSELTDIYKALEKNYPDDDDPHDSTRVKLFEVLWKICDYNTYDFLKELYPKLPKNPDITFAALRTFGEINTPESIDRMLDILIIEKPEIDGRYYGVFAPLYDHTDNVDSIFPRIFELLKNPEIKESVYDLAAFYRDEELLSADLVDEIRGRIIEDYNALMRERASVPQGSEKYNKLSEILGRLVDCMSSYERDREILDILRKSLNDSSTNVSMYAALSLIKLCHDVPREVRERIAADPLKRLEFYEALQMLETLDRFDSMNQFNIFDFFPEEYCTGRLFAEADMVRWLSLPTGMGKPPLAIELLDEKLIMMGPEKGRVYLFKFQYPEAEGGWMVGISGAQPAEEFEVRTVGGMTFSYFYKLEEMSEEEHFARLLLGERDLVEEEEEE